MYYSSTEENYIKVIYHLSSQNQEASTNAIAEIVQTRPASVSDMLRKLSEKNLVNYVKYKGVSLTEKGQKAALYIIRKHRLWEVFLVEKLKFSWEEVHEVAEQLEHIDSNLLIKRLDDFLGHPTHDPHGDPIPNEKGEMPTHEHHVLSDLSSQTKGIVRAVKDDSPSFLRYLNKVGIYIGASIQILEKIEFDGSMEISLDEHKAIIISGGVSQNILVELA